MKSGVMLAIINHKDGYTEKGTLEGARGAAAVYNAHATSHYVNLECTWTQSTHTITHTQNKHSPKNAFQQAAKTLQQSSIYCTHMHDSLMHKWNLHTVTHLRVQMISVTWPKTEKQKKRRKEEKKSESGNRSRFLRPHRHVNNNKGYFFFNANP